MAIAQSLATLAQWMAGEFENRAQALDQPIWFVSLRLWYRPLPFLIEGNLALFAEQANILQLQHPYRQRIAVLHQTAATDPLQAHYLAFKQPERFQGAGANPTLLLPLTPDDLEVLPGCVLTITPQEQSFEARMAPETQCCFQYQGETRQVVLGFDAFADRFLSYDRGVDPQTGKSLWGAMIGPYDFKKCHDFSQELPLAAERWA
jgi:hypothetical protein